MRAGVSSSAEGAAAAVTGAPRGSSDGRSCAGRSRPRCAARPRRSPSAASSVCRRRARAAAAATAPPEPAASTPSSGVTTSPLPERRRIVVGSASTSTASSRRMARSVRHSFASSMAALRSCPLASSSLPSKRSRSASASAAPPAKPASTAWPAQRAHLHGAVLLHLRRRASPVRRRRARSARRASPRGSSSSWASRGVRRGPRRLRGTGPHATPPGGRVKTGPAATWTGRPPPVASPLPLPEPRMPTPMETTLVLVKPDGVQRGLVGEILGRLERKGLQIVGLKLAKYPARRLRAPLRGAQGEEVLRGARGVHVVEPLRGGGRPRASRPSRSSAG